MTAGGPLNLIIRVTHLSVVTTVVWVVMVGSLCSSVVETIAVRVVGMWATNGISRVLVGYCEILQTGSTGVALGSHVDVVV